MVDKTSFLHWWNNWSTSFQYALNQKQFFERHIDYSAHFEVWILLISSSHFLLSTNSILTVKITLYNLCIIYWADRALVWEKAGGHCPQAVICLPRKICLPSNSSGKGVYFTPLPGISIFPIKYFVYAMALEQGESIDSFTNTLFKKIDLMRFGIRCFNNTNKNLSK